MEQFTIYSKKEIKTLEDIQSMISICYDPPEERCVCPQCFEYEITIDKVQKKEAPYCEEEID